MMKNYLVIFSFFIFLTACNNSSPTEGIKYHIKKIRCQRDIDLPSFGKNTTVEIFENWVVITYSDSNKVVINRDKIWSIEVE